MNDLQTAILFVVAVTMLADSLAYPLELEMEYSYAVNRTS